MWTQLGRWRTIAAAMSAQQLLAQAPGDRLPTTVRLRLEQLFYLQHEYIRDEVLLQPRNIPLHTGEATSLLSERSKEVWVATHATLEYAPQLGAAGSVGGTGVDCAGGSTVTGPCCALCG